MYSLPDIDDAIKMRGRLVLHLTREDGSEQITEVDNLVVTVGKSVVADRMKAAPALAAMTHMATGTGATAPAVGDAALAAENGRVGLAATNVAGAVITYTATFGPGASTGTLAEAGIFNATPGGQMLARTTFAPIPKNAGDTLSVTWTVTVG